MADGTTVPDCSTSLYCTKSNLPLSYQQPFVVQWNNKFPPLNPESIVTIRVYSGYDTSAPIYQVNGVSNNNGIATLSPVASWYGKYTGASDAGGKNQPIYFAVSLQGNDPPAIKDMLPLKLTATDEQYKEIQNILHPPPPPSSTLATSSAASASMSKQTVTVTASDSQSKQTNLSTLVDASASASASSSSVLGKATETPGADSSSSHGRKGLSGGAIAGIVVGSVVGLLLLILLLVLLLRRRSRKSKALAKSAALEGMNDSGDGPSHLGTNVTTTAVGGAMIGEKAGGNKSISDAPLLAYAGKSAGSFVSHEGSLHEGAGAYQPLSLDSPRVLMHVPRSTRSSRSNSMVQQDPASIVSGRRNLLIKEQEEKDLKDPILSSVDAKQIGDIFRDALRKPPPVSEDGNASDSPGHRESMMILSNEDDDLDEEELDPGWRERVASERMIRELEQEASVIRTVAKKAHGSDYSSSRPETSQSDHAHQLQSPLQSPFES